MTDRDIPGHSAADVDLSDGDAVIVSLHFRFVFTYIIIHGWE